MDIQKYIAILEEHRENLRPCDGLPSSLNKYVDLREALDFAIDSLKAVDESLNKTEEAEEPNVI